MQRKSINKSFLTAHYIMSMAPVLNVEALFSDESSQFVSPMEPKSGDLVAIRLRTATENVDEVWLVTRHGRTRMDFEKTSGVFDYYRCEVTMGKTVFSYYFEVRSGQISVILAKNGISDQADDRVLFRICPDFSTPDWAKGAVIYQIFTDRFSNGDPGNDVLDNEYCYIGKNVRHILDWSKRPEEMDVCNFYGGDLEGVRQKLDYLENLGVEVIYFNPLFVSPSNHKYDTQDYEHIDPHFGLIDVDNGDVLTDVEGENSEKDKVDGANDREDGANVTGNDKGAGIVSSRYVCRTLRRENLDASDRLFIQLVREAHERGIRVILDGVFNHCGSFNKWMDRVKMYEGQSGYEDGAYISDKSPYSDFFYFRDKNAWPDNDSYEGWWGYSTLPKLNYEGSEELVSDVLKIARRWVSKPFCADGWRLDVASELGHSTQFNHNFWKLFRKAVKDANPDALIIAEHYGDAREWIQGDQWDSIMNYDAFMEPVTWFFTGMEKHSDRFLPDQIGNADLFFSSMRYYMCSFMWPSLLCSMNELSNHDHSRFLTRTNHKTGRASSFDYDAASEGVEPAVMREAVILQMTWPGAPAVYYGDEAGVCGFTDPDNRRTYPWGHEDKDMLEFHRQVISMHKSHKCLRTGSVKFLKGDYNILAYARFNEAEQIICVFNNGRGEKTVGLPVWTCGVPMEGSLDRIFYSDAKTFTTNVDRIAVAVGIITVTLPGTSAVVYCGDMRTELFRKGCWK